MRTLLSFLCCAVLVGAAPGCGQKEQPGDANAAVKTPAPASSPAKPASSPATAEAPEAAGAARVTASLEYVPEPGAEDPPRARVFLTITEEGKPPQKHDLGKFSGCSDTTEMVSDLLAQITCYWAGAGDQFDLSHDGEFLVVHHTLSDEGMEEVPDPKEVFRYKLPEGAEVKSRE